MNSCLAGGLVQRVRAVCPVLPGCDELRHRERREVRHYDLNACGACALGAMKLVDTELPDGERLQDSAFSAVVAPDDQIKAGKVVDLLAYALEVSQCQFFDHLACS